MQSDFLIMIVDDYINSKGLQTKNFILFNFSIILIRPMCTIITSGTPGKSDITNSTISFPAINIPYYNFTISIYPETSIWWPSGLQIKSVLIVYTKPRTQ